MPASEMHLELWLQEAVMEEVLSLQEAWSIQDSHLLAPDLEYCPLPSHLWHLAERLYLHESEPFNSLPL